MRIPFGLAALMVGLVGLSSASFAQVAFEMEPPISPPAGTTEVIGGKPAEPSNWPATFVFRSPGGGCTSTVVGERTILTAAHCVKNGASGQITLRDGTKRSVRCDHHPKYNINRTMDFALCLADQPLQGFPYERIGTSLALARVGDTVRMVGYGCRQEGGVDHSFGVLYTGTAEVIRTPEGSDIDTITQGGAALCYGDSGGASYSRRDATGRLRGIIGVNSRGDISTYSYLSTTATAAFVGWAFTWSATNQVQVCGVHVSALGCRP